MAHPRMFDDSNPLIRRLRKICLAMPQVFEKEAWGECTFRVTGGSMFAMTDCNHHDSGHTAVWVKQPPMVQEILVGAAPERFFKPPYLGHKGWVGMRLDKEVSWEEVAAILDDGYRLSVPAKLRRAASQSVTEKKASKSGRSPTAKAGSGKTPRSARSSRRKSAR